MNSFKKLNISFNLLTLLVNIVFLLFYFFYFNFRIDAKLFYQAQQPVFYFDRFFCSNFLSTPGGILELFSKFLAQFFFHSWSGALILTGVFGLVALISWMLVRLINNKQSVPFLHWLPTLFLFVLHHDYNHPLSISIGLFVALFAVFLFIRFSPQHTILRFLSFIVFYGFLYYLSGGPALLFAIIVIVYDIFFLRHIIVSIAYLLIALIVPWVGHTYLFILPLEKAYFIHLGNFLSTSAWPLYLVYLFFPFFILMSALANKVKIFESAIRKINAKNRLAIVIKSAIILTVFILLAGTFFQKKQKALWQMDYHARHGEWQQVIHVIQNENLLDNYIGQLQLHRALYHTDRLCEALFVFPQQSKSDALFLHKDARHLFPLQYSDLFFDLGLINEAQHWAHEALSVTGDTPCNLQRLAEVNILKGENAVAKKCLRQLQKSMWHKKWATTMLTAMEESDYSAFPYMVQKKQLLLSNDFIVVATHPQNCLEALLAANNANKMAFEYNMATLLLDGKVGRMIKQLDGLRNIPYSKTPRHIEEALLLYILNTGRQDFRPPGPGISRETIAAFRDYVAITKKYKDIASAYRELATKYSDTFWFYASYIYKKDS